MEYMSLYRAQTHVEIGTEASRFPFLGIFVSNFQYCVFAVWTQYFKRLHIKIYTEALFDMVTCESLFWTGTDGSILLNQSVFKQTAQICYFCYT
jgi:hypothetical protein